MVEIGTDVYGAVRRVSGASIVTQFMMFQGVPTYPLRSYYFLRLGPASYSGVPFIAMNSKRSIVGIPCARLNYLSVCITYFRAALGLLIVFSCTIAFAFLVAVMSGQNANQELRIIERVAFVALASSTALGLATYLFTFYVPSRERRIRQACKSSMGIAADPAFCDRTSAERLIAHVSEALDSNAAYDVEQAIRQPHGRPKELLQLVLVRVRAQMQLDGPSDVYEAATDRLLAAMELETDRTTAEAH